MKKARKITTILLSILALFVGVLGGTVGFAYSSMPETDELIIGEETYYSYSDNTELVKQELPNQPGEVSVHFLELGNVYTGDCTYIRYNSETAGVIDILIDCGSKSNSVPTVSKYLEQYMGEDKTLEYVIVTHAHLDHYAGFATSGKTQGIFDIYDCKNIIDFGEANNQTSKAYSNYVAKRTKEIETGANYFDVSTQTKNNNKIIEIDSQFSIEILYNDYQYQKNAKSENDYSVCTLITHNDKKMLFTGDLEKHGEEMLVENNNLPKVDLYKAGHHGSGTSSNDCLLDVIDPDVVCICCCAGSSEYTKNIDNQFPTQAFINRIKSHTDKIYVTTLCVDFKKGEYTSMNGNIVVISMKDEVLSFMFSNNSTILKDSEWFSRPRTDENGNILKDASNNPIPMRVW